MEDVPLFKRIRNITYEKYNTLKGNGKPQPHEWTVLASIVMENDNNLSVIAITTGTKCIGKTHIDNNGFAVRDCHAEVLCRRALIYYLMDEIKKVKSGDHSVIIEQCDDSIPFRVKTSCKLHLYISQTPCGCASEYKVQGAKRTALEIFNSKQRSSKRIHQSEAESNVDTLLHNEMTTEQASDSLHHSGAKYIVDSLQLSHKPGRGDPSRSYSCSDKLCLWNYIGLQGSLLSLLLQPVYYTSITISGDSDDKITTMALKERLHVNNYNHYHLNNALQLYYDHEYAPVSEIEVMKRLQGKQKMSSSGSSFIWIISSIREALIAGHGVKLGTNIKKQITEKNCSCLSSYALFKKFHTLYDCNETYGVTKNKAKEYQMAKTLAMSKDNKDAMSKWERKDQMYYNF